MSTDRTDWAALRAMTEEEIERLAEEDEDNPATDESHWVGATIYVSPQLVPPIDQPPGGQHE